MGGDCFRTSSPSKFLAVFFAIGFGSGLLPISGTFGSLVGIVIYLSIKSAGASFAVSLAILIWTLLIGFYFCDVAGKIFGKADHSAIVWDEVVGMLMVLILMPKFQNNVLAIFIAFLLFRFFDIFKPPPARQIDKHWHNGVGVMLDDVTAGIYAIICMWVIYYLQIF